MTKIFLILNIAFNLIFIKFLEVVISCFIPEKWLPFNSTIRTLIIYLIVLIFLYTEMGQRCVAFFVRGRNTIGREEKVLQPIVEELKDRNDIKGFSKPVLVEYKIMNGLNNLTAQKIKILDRKVNKMKFEYMTGTVKIFSLDSLDIETNSYGNSIFISKGAIDTLSQGELRAVIHNEFAQIKTNIANLRLLHDSNLLLGRISAIAVVILSPIALTLGIIGNSYLSSITGTGATEMLNNVINKISLLVPVCVFSLVRIIAWAFTKKYSNLFYMFFERKIFIRADRATHKAGYSNEMINYLEKLYAFKLGDKEYSKLFVELRPLVAYRINYFDNVLGKNIGLSKGNYAWSSNYMERVQTVNNNKNV